METKLTEWKIEELINYRGNGDLKVNPEYQRGAVWNESQMRLLIDSVLRGYQIPLIYLRKVERKNDRMSSTHYDIIDGQQRINALRSFKSGSIIEEDIAGDRGAQKLKPLYDPSKKEDREKIPIALQDQECPWAGKKFNDLDSATKERLLSTKVSVAEMECDDNEARDLFIRLQGGSDLSPQEIRDAWPGNFCQAILEIGGKPQMTYPGHDFFLKVLKSRPSKDRGKSRQLAAQLLMLYLKQQENGPNHFAPIKSKSLDGYYREQVGLSLESAELREFHKILEKLAHLFGDGKRPPLKGHDAIHLILFVDMLIKHYAPVWERGIVHAFEDFTRKINDAKKHKDFPKDEDKDTQDAWSYYFKTRSSSDKPETIQDRHAIYKRLMLEYLGNNAKEKDPQRGYTSQQREDIYYRDKKLCHVCQELVKWEDAEIDHIDRHSEGGQTTMENGKLVHKQCHERGPRRRNSSS